MEFNFPFPSLKQLSIITICQHWSDNNLGLFSEIRQDSRSIYPLFEKYNYMVNQLSIAAELKLAVCEVVYGICIQIHNWAQEFSKFPSVDKFYFDSYGRFDIDRTVEHFVKNQVAAVEDLSALHELFSQAVARSWIPEMDMVLRKMVAVALQPMDVQLEGPNYEIQDRRQTVRYRFLQELDSETADKVNCLTSLTSNYVSIDSNEDGLVLMPKPTHWSFKLFEKLPESSEKQFVLDSFTRKLIPTSHLLQTLTLIEKAKKRSWFSYISEDGNELLHIFLRRLLIWPYTMHFAPAFKLLYPYLGEVPCVCLFMEMFLLILSQNSCGMLHDDLFVAFWSLASASVKLLCAKKYMESLFPVFLQAMMLVGPKSHKKKVFEIHSIIIAEYHAKRMAKIAAGEPVSDSDYDSD